jgi:hypothetical protein
MVTSYSDASTQSTCAVVTIAPILGRRGWYTAHHDGRLLCRSKHPICDGARALRGSGYPPDNLLFRKDAGSRISVLTTTIARAAIAASLALQHGCSVELLRTALSHDSQGTR